MEFKFEPGNYYLAGREQLDGQQVLRIEYYPTRMFSDDDESKDDRQADERGRSENATRQKRETASERSSGSSAR